METEKKPDYDKILNIIHDFYIKQVLLIKDFYEFQYDNFENIKNERINSLYHLLFSMYQTGSAIQLLSANNLLGESYILARALLEKIITYLYVICCDEIEYEKYLNYTKQKGYTILDRAFSTGTIKAEIKWAGVIDIDSYPDLKEAVNQFTSKKGKTITHWTNFSVKNMLAKIEENGKIKIEILALSTLGIYDDASEALHGTLYGSTFFYGFFEGKMPSNVQEFTEGYRNRLLVLFSSLGGSIDALFHLVSNYCTNEKIQELYKVSRENSDNYSKRIKLIENA